MHEADGRAGGLTHDQLVQMGVYPPGTFFEGLTYPIPVDAFMARLMAHCTDSTDDDRRRDASFGCPRCAGRLAK
jgi:hypothetical protein